MTDPGMCNVCPAVKRIGFALETQGQEPPVTFTQNTMHSFSVAADGDERHRQNVNLFQTVVWLESEEDLQTSSKGYPWRDYTHAQTTTLHQTDDLDFIPVLPRPKAGRP